MATMDHINVVRLYSVCMGKQMMLISQFVRLGSLLSFLKNNQATLDAYTMLNFSKQIADVGINTVDGLMLPQHALDWQCVVAKSQVVPRTISGRQNLSNLTNHCVYRVKFTIPLIFYI